MKKIYFSCSISGTRVATEDFQMLLVEHMKEMGFKVLSEHVAIFDKIQRFKILSKNSKVDIPKREGFEKEIRDIDTKWVDQADYIVAIVDGPSLGVGMEVERALLRSQRGLVQAPILCLVHENNYLNLSAMIKGIQDPCFYLKTYKDTTEASNHLSNFLKTKLKHKS